MGPTDISVDQVNGSSVGSAVSGVPLVSGIEWLTGGVHTSAPVWEKEKWQLGCGLEVQLGWIVQANIGSVRLRLTRPARA